MRIATEIDLTETERDELVTLVRSKLTSVRLALRARIILLASEGMQSKDIAAELGVERGQVSRWRGRYATQRLAGIERDLPRGAAPLKVDVARLVALTTESKPEAATHWSTRTMAAQLGVSAATICRHWQAKGLKPHLVRGFKISRDPKFVEKLVIYASSVPLIVFPWPDFQTCLLHVHPIKALAASNGGLTDSLRRRRASISATHLRIQVRHILAKTGPVTDVKKTRGAGTT